MINIP